MPPPVLVAELPQVRAFAAGVDERVTRLAEAGWPGALTMVLKAQSSLQLDLGERGDTIAVRIPDHEFTRELLRRTGPLAVSSANVSGSEAALTVDEAVSMLGDTVAVYLDAGPALEPQPSTILDMSGPQPSLLRAGRLGVEQLNAIVPGLLPEEEPDESDVPTGEPVVSEDSEVAPESVEVPTTDATDQSEPPEPAPSD